jgi:hypothetical protein
MDAMPRIAPPVAPTPEGVIRLSWHDVFPE